MGGELLQGEIVACCLVISEINRSPRFGVEVCAPSLSIGVPLTGRGGDFEVASGSINQSAIVLII